MREVLTGLAILICIALIGAMAGPYFVDWNQHRAFFEARLGEATGHRARIDGRIALTLLPTPSLAIEQLRLGPQDAAGLAMIEAERVAAALQATALMRGDIIITEAHVDRPVVRIGAAGFAALAGRPPQHRANPEAVSIERLQVYDGALHIARPGREALLISEINGDFEATSLLGPAKGNATFVMDGANRHIRLALGRLEGARARLKLLFEDLSSALRLDLDGALDFAAGRPDFAGTAALTANPVILPRDKLQLPVRATAAVKAGGETIALDDIALTFGSDPRPLTLAGAGSIRLGAAPFVDLTLAGRSYDFDWPGPDGKPRHAIPAQLLRQLTDLGAGAGGGAASIDGRLDLSVGGLIIGGQTLIGAHVVVEQTGGRPRIALMEGELPGQTVIRFAHDNRPGGDLISGTLDFSARDPERLHGWFHGIQRTVTAVAALKATATLSSVPGGIGIDRVEIDRGATRLTGAGSYLLAAPGLRPAPRLALRLASPRLTIADIPAYAVGTDAREEKPNLDFEVDLEAARLVHEGRETGRLVARARRDGAITSIERIAISELDGASLIASGTLGGGARRVTVKLDAERLGGIAAMAEQVFPGAVTAALRARAAQLQPALVIATLANDEAEANFALNAEGKLAGTDLKLDGRVGMRGDIDLALALTLNNPDSAALLAQVIAAPPAARQPLPGEVRLALKGNPRAALGLTLDAVLAGATARINGDIRLFQTFAPFTGSIAMDAGDLAPLAAALGFDAAAVPPATPGRLTGTLDSALGEISIENLAASIGTAPIRGEVSFKRADGGRLMGQLKLPSVNLGAIAAIALGPLPQPHDGRGWSAAPFGKPLAPPISGDLWIEAEEATLAPGVKVEAPRFVVRFAPDQAGIEHADMIVAGTRLTGDLALKRIGVAAYLTSRLKWAGLPLARLAPQSLRGSAEGEIQLSGRGESLARIMQSLAGTGTARLRDGALAAFDPAALPRLLAIPVAEIGPVDAPNIIRRLEAEMARAPLNLADLPLGLVVIDGAARLTGGALTRGDVRLEPSGTLDLARLSVDLRLQATAPAPAGWIGPPPQMLAQWRGAAAEMRRSLSVESLLNGLLAIALQIDLERAQIQEQDARERAFFNRRRRAAEEERRAAEEAEAQRIEAERLAERTRLMEEERLRREEERARKAKEEAAAAERALRTPIAPPPVLVPAPPRPAPPRAMPPAAAPPLNLLPPG